MQQDYARNTGLAEALPPAVLVEEALRMTSSIPLENGIEIVRNYGTSGRGVAEGDGVSLGAAFTPDLPIAQMEAAA